MEIPSSSSPWSRLSDHDLELRISVYRMFLRLLPLETPLRMTKIIGDLQMEKLSRSNKKDLNLPEKSSNDWPNSTGSVPSGICNDNLAKRQHTASKRKGEGISRSRQGVGGVESLEEVVQLISSEDEELKKPEWERLLKEKEDLLQHSFAQQETMRKEMEDAARETQALKQTLKEKDHQIASQTRSQLECERLLKEKEDLLEQTLNVREVMKKGMEDAVRETQALKQNLKEKDEKMEYIVCMDEFGEDLSKQRAHYKDCNHANICFGCATTLWQQGNRRCPSCNTTATGMPLCLPARIFL